MLLFLARLKDRDGWHPVRDSTDGLALLCDCLPRDCETTIMVARHVHNDRDLDLCCKNGKAAFLMAQMGGDT